MTTNEPRPASDPPVGPESQVKISPSVYVRAFGAELVLLDFGRGEYFGLDEVGAEIWRGLEAGQALGAVADTISGRYDVGREDALRDIVTLVSDMRLQGLVSVTERVA